MVAVVVLAALPALAGGLLPWAGGRIEEPFAVRVPGLTRPSAQVPDQAPAGRDRDDDSSGSGRSGGGSGGSSGPG